MPRLQIVFILLLVTTLTACNGANTAAGEDSDALREALLATAPPVTDIPPTMPPAATQPPTEPAPTEPSAPTEAIIIEVVPTSFEAATYTDAVNGFTLQYPAEWEAPVLFEQHSRGTIYQSYLAGEPKLDIVVLKWDPKGDLDAFVEQRKQAASGLTIVTEEQYELNPGHTAVRFVVQSSEGQGVFCYTTIGEQYLQVSGQGDLELISEVCKTVRVLG